MAHRAKWVIHRATHQEDEIQIQEIQFLSGKDFYNNVMMTSSIDWEYDLRMFKDPKSSSFDLDRIERRIRSRIF